MKAPYSWLKELLPGLTASPEEVGKALTSAGLELDAIVKVGGEGLDKVFVGTLLEVKQHPNAERLTVCKVRIGDGERQIVCGAKNHKAGDKVAVALVGAKLPNGAKIEKAKMRGEVSEGMLCSVKELGLGEEADGIWILPSDTPEGANVADAMGLADTVLEIGVTPNRGDCLSMIGLAIEAGAALGLAVKRPAVSPVAGAEAGKKIAVIVEDRAGCPRYTARVIEGVTIKPSPAWMKRRLELSGVRPINAVVDVTNYVMLETGQPLHAFDARDLKGERGAGAPPAGRPTGGGTPTEAGPISRIVVRAARQGEKMKTLDGVERTLSANDLVIADAERPVAIAGVMGGEHSGVRDDTKTVVLESAWFDPGRVRRTSRAHGLHTESSHRFERAVDPAGVDAASARAASLLAELAGGKVLGGSVDVSAGAVAPRTITLRLARVEKILGVAVPAKKIVELFAPLELPARQDGDALAVTVPPRRPDLVEEIDLIEEVARRLGYDAIPERRPVSALSSEAAPVDVERARSLRQILVALGFHETVHLPFGPRDEAKRMKLVGEIRDPRTEHVPIANPLADDQAVLRATILPVLLANLGRQQAQGTHDVKIFELRPAFRRRENELPHENRRVAGLLAGNRLPAHWSGKPVPVDFYDAKGAVEALVEAFAAKPVIVTPAQEPFLVEGAQARVDLPGGFSAKTDVAGRGLGIVGEVHPEVLEAFGVESGTRAFVFDLDYDALAAAAGSQPIFAELPRFPSVVRDVALVVDESVAAGSLLAATKSFERKGLASVTIFDVFRGGKLPAGRKSIALTMVYRAADKTLTDVEVNATHERLVTELVTRFKAERRS